MWLRCKECGYEFKVPENFKNLASTWCRKCGRSTPIIDVEKDAKACKDLAIGLGIIVGFILYLLWKYLI